MKEIKHTIPDEYLEEIANSPTKRHATIVAGWLNASHGNTPENRRAIQNTIMERNARLKNISLVTLKVNSDHTDYGR